jgi:membrane protein DedA with SNARE-associated domain
VGGGRREADVRLIALIAAALLVGVSVWRLRQGRRRRALLGLGGAVLLVVFAASGGIGLPDGEGAVNSAADALEGWIYPFAVGMAFFETTIPPITLIYPGEWGLMLCGAIAGAGRADLIPLLLIGWLVSAAGDSLTFLLGRRLGRPFLLRSGRGIGLTEERLGNVDRWFARYGPLAACFGRLLPLVRPFGPFLAGASKLEYRRFLPWNVLGCLFFSVVFVGLGYAFYNSYDQVAETVGRVGLVVLVLVVAAVMLVRDLRRRGAPAKEPAL